MAKKQSEPVALEAKQDTLFGDLRAAYQAESDTGRKTVWVDNAYNARMFALVAQKKAAGLLPANKSNPFDHAVLMGNYPPDFSWEAVRQSIKNQIAEMQAR